jgi:DNA-binding transcriptional LysR family regulator
VAVAEREHVTKAAEALNLTQSATSAAVSALEERYQTRLFDRVGRRIILTAAGRIFLGEARAVLARAYAAETVLADLAGLKRGWLKLAGSQTVANYWLPTLVHRFRTNHPGIELSLTIANTETVAKMVHECSVDLGFVEGEVDDPALLTQSVGEDELLLVAAPGHPWTVDPPVSVQDLCSVPWVLREPGSGTRAHLDAVRLARGIDVAHLEVALELPSNESVRAAVEAGAGVAVMSRLVAESALGAGRLVAISFDLPRRSFYSLCHKERHLTRAADEFLRLSRCFPV